MCVTHLGEGWSLLASSLAIKGKARPQVQGDPVQKEQVESDRRALKRPGIPACRQCRDPCGRASSSRHRPKCSSGNTEYSPGLLVPSNKCRPKVSGKFSHKKLKEWFLKHAFLRLCPPKTIYVIFRFHLFYTCVYVHCVYHCICCACCPQNPRGHQVPWTGVTSSCPAGAVSTVRAQVLLSTEAPLQSCS